MKPQACSELDRKLSGIMGAKTGLRKVLDYIFGDDRRV
jgi:hypothetical protein